MNRISTWIPRGWRLWEGFWFESARPESWALFRSTLAVLLFFYFLTRTPDLMFLYSQSGVLPTAVMEQVMPMGYRLSPLNWIQSDWAIWVCHFALLSSLASLALGLCPGIASISAFVLHVSFIHRNMASAYGIDSIATFFLLNLVIGGSSSGSMRSSLGLRLSQLQVCIIYFYSGMEKIRGAQWWKGEAVWDVLANGQLARWDFSWISGVPVVVALATWSTLLWEVYFPALIWVRKLRYPMLVFGVVLHLGIGTAMSIPYFGSLMICSYALFLERKDARRVTNYSHRVCTKILKVFRRSPMSTMSG